MKEYKMISRKTFGKEDTLLEGINKEARNNWRVTNAGYTMDGSLIRVMLERTTNN